MAPDGRGRIRLRLSGFSRQTAVPVEAIVEALNILPDRHLAGLREILYLPLRSAMRRNDSSGFAPRIVKGEYDPQTRNVGVFGFSSSAELFHILFHEIGHHVYFSVLEAKHRRAWAGALSAGEPSLTACGEESVGEDFAESYAFFVCERSMLRMAAPEKFRFLDEQVFACNEAEKGVRPAGP